MTLIDLSDVRPDQLADVGGKAVGLARLIAAGERVPAGFVITTDTQRSGVVPQDELITWWRERLGSAPVAVRSSATAEDLADASFAGQQDTILGVDTADGLVAAVQQCWDSLHSERAVAYRAALPEDRDGDTLSMGVVVQLMVDARAAGVLFTANPITGLRSQQVVDAAAGLGDVVVDGSVDAEHGELDDGRTPIALDCLDVDRLTELQRAGRRIEAALGTPQDIEFAVDHDETLWLLQSRAITTLFPVPEEVDGATHAYVEVGHLQGLVQPMTPLGIDLMFSGIEGMAETFGDLIRSVVRFIGGRMYFDLTPMLRSRSMRRRLGTVLETYGSDPGLAESLLSDPGLVPVAKSVREHVATAAAVAQTSAKVLPALLSGMVLGLADPVRARERALAVRISDGPLADTASAEQRLDRAVSVQGEVLSQKMWRMLPPLYSAIAAREIARGLLAGVAEPGDIDQTQRGMPHNPTTEMDLALWQVAEQAEPHRELLLNATPGELVVQWRNGTLPDFGLDGFLAEYGHRCAVEIDVGVTRWAEDPAPVLAALIGYLQLTDPEQAPDVRFARASAEAQEMIAVLEARAEAQGRRRRGAVAGWLLRRGREVTGLRELPKFVWVQAVREARGQLLAIGEELTARGVLDRRDDIFFLELAELRAALDGVEERCPWAERAAQRRAEHDRETRRVQIPPVLLSNGLMPTSAPPETDGDTIIGRAAAAGVHTGRARVVRDPRTARVEPGEILVAPTTDPGWTPLFMTAGGLICETGSPMAHGPTVAREYGIPAVIGIGDATARFATGDLLTIDGSRGTVVVEHPTATDPALDEST